MNWQKCQKCGSDRIATVSSKCNDLCTVTIKEKESDTYVPEDMGIGGGSYTEFDYCLDCGQIKGEFPLKITELENKETVDKEDVDTSEFKVGGMYLKTKHGKIDSTN